MPGGGALALWWSAVQLLRARTSERERGRGCQSFKICVSRTGRYVLSVLFLMRVLDRSSTLRLGMLKIGSSPMLVTSVFDMFRWVSDCRSAMPSVNWGGGEVSQDLVNENCDVTHLVGQERVERD